MLGNVIDYRAVDDSSFKINDRTSLLSNYQTSPHYYIAVTSVDGLFTSDISYESHPIPNTIGEKSGDVFRRGKTLTFTGNIEARDLSSLYNGAYFLEEMLAEKELRKLVFIPWNYNVNLYIGCRPYQDLSVVISFDSYNYIWPFTFALRADDPRSYLLVDDSLFPTFQQ